MPHENPGYDVISRDGTGRILRHIEVKSVGGAWDDMGVGLSRTQFDFAQQHQDTFWLYVVEYALDDERARVLRIADPAGRAEEFRFDDGWSAVSEDARSWRASSSRKSSSPASARLPCPWTHWRRENGDPVRNSRLTLLLQALRSETTNPPA